MQCNAKTRGGGRCKNPPVRGSKRCRMHGGNSLRGINSPRYKHGLYSKYAGQSLRDVLGDLEGVPSDELINPENEIRLMQALILSAQALKKGISDLKDLDTMSKIIDRLVSAKQRSMVIQIEQRRLIPASDIEAFLAWLENLLIERVGDEGYIIIDHLKTFKLSEHPVN